MFSRRWTFRVFGFWVRKTLKTCGLALYASQELHQQWKKPLWHSEAEIVLFQFYHFLGTTKSQMGEHSLARDLALLDNQSSSSLIPSRKRPRYTLFHIRVAVHGRVSSRSAQKLFVCVFLIIFTIGINYLNSDRHCL
jgi:hypothetical protein